MRQLEGLAGHDEINRCRVAVRHHVQAVGVIDAPKPGFKIDGQRLFVGHSVNPLDIQFLEVHGVPRFAFKSAKDCCRILDDGFETATDIACRYDYDHISS